MTTHIFYATLLLTTLLIQATPAVALTFERPKPWILSLTGPIKPGDSERLVKELLRQTPREDGLGDVSTVQLASPGGDVLEAARIAQLLDVWFVRTEVPRGEQCGSSCFLVFLAGFKRDAEALNGGNSSVFGSIAIHRPVVIARSETVEHLQSMAAVQVTAMAALRKHLLEKNVPGYLIELMMQHGSNESYTLNDSDLWNIGRHKPEIEEVLIRTCGYQRQVDKELYTSNADRLTSEELLRLDERSARVADCLHQEIEIPYSMQERPKIRKKLQAGWRPWKTK